MCLYSEGYVHKPVSGDGTGRRTGVAAAAGVHRVLLHGLHPGGGLPAGSPPLGR